MPATNTRPSSYQKLKARLAESEENVATLKKELLAKGNVFFKDKMWLGINKVRLGAVIDGKLECLKDFDI